MIPDDKKEGVKAVVVSVMAAFCLLVIVVLCASLLYKECYVLVRDDWRFYGRPISVPIWDECPIVTNRNLTGPVIYYSLEEIEKKELDISS